MQPIKSIIEGVIKDIQQKQEQCPKGKIEDIWFKCVKKSTAKHTKVSFFKKGKIYINTENPAWLYELNSKKDDIVQRLQKLSKNKIKDAMFRVGEINDNRK